MTEDPNKIDAAFGDTTLNVVSQPPVVLEPGEIVLEKFRIIELLGRGGMGSVYRVEHLMVNRMYALKCLSKCQSNDGSWRRFQNEIKAAHVLDHPNLIRVYEFGLLPGAMPFFLMEIVDGPTLADEIKKAGGLELERAVKIFIHVAFAIQYAHDHKVVHRDLKPSNIMLAKPHYEHEKEVVKVVDFGIAKLTGFDEFNQQTLTKTGEIFGSPLYMSPEQCMGIAVDHRSDLYSLGCVLYETLTGAPPFIGESALSTMLKHQSDNPLSLKEASMGSQFPDELERIIAKLLEKEPDNRYQTANALAEDLIAIEKKFKGEEQIPAVKSVMSTAAQKIEKGKKKMAAGPNIYVLIGACAATFLLGIILCYWLIIMQKSAAPHVKLLPTELNNLSDNPSLVGSSPHGREALPALQRVGILTGNDDKGSSAFSDQPMSTASLEKAGGLKGEGSQEPVASAVADDSEAKLAKFRDKPWSTRTANSVVFNFPKDNSLGILELEDGRNNPALGTIKLRKDEPICLQPGPFLLHNPQLLGGFRPEDLSGIDFLGAKNIVNPAVFRQLSRLSGLRIINLSGTEFSDKDLKYIGYLPNLKYLNIATSAVSCRSLVDMPNLKDLACLDVTVLKDGELLAAKISSLPNLKQLVIAGSDIGDEDVAKIARSKSLKVLCLANNDITDEGVKELISLKTLEWLDLTQTPVTAKCAKYLAQMPNLRKVELEGVFTKGEQRDFAQYMMEHNPKVTVLWENVSTMDMVACLPELPWRGSAIKPHLDLNFLKTLSLPVR